MRDYFNLLRQLVLIIGLSLFSFTKVKSQKENCSPWTLKQCIDYAVNNNLSIRYYSSTIQQREISASNAKMSALPVISGGINQSFGFGRALTSSNTYDQRNTSNTSLNIGASAVLFQGFYRKNHIKQSQLNLGIAKSELEGVKNDLILNIITLYLKVLLADELIQVNKTHYELSQLQFSLIKRQEELGRCSKVDVFSAKSVIVQDSVSYVSSINDYEMSLFDLCQLLEIPKDSFVVASPNGEVEFEVLDNPHDIFNIAKNERPEIRVAELRVLSAERQVAMARSSFFPTLKISASMSSNYYKTDGWQNAQFSDQIRNNFSQSVNLSLTIPIFSAFSSRNSVKIAEVQKTQSEIQLDIEKKNLKKAIEQAYNNVVVARSNYASSRSVVEATSVTYDMVKTKFDSGKASHVELDKAHFDYIKAESSLVVAKYELLLKLKIYDFYKSGVEGFK